MTHAHNPQSAHYRIMRGSIIAIFGSAILVVLATLIFLIGGAVTGTYRALPVLSNSMQPALSRGDIVLVHPVTASHIHKHDIVVVKPPAENGALIVHRVFSVDHRNSTSFMTKGDANLDADAWTLHTSSKKTMKVVATVPNPFASIAPTTAISILLIFSALAFSYGAARVLKRVWSRKPKLESQP